MSQPPDKRVRYFTRPSAEVLEGFLERECPAMPSAIRTQSIRGWLKAVTKSGGRTRDGRMMIDWQASFRTYANACWGNSRMRG